MSTVILQVELKSEDVSLFQGLLKKFKAKSTVIKEEKDDTKMTKEEYFKMIDERRAGEKIEMSRDEIRKIMFG